MRTGTHQLAICKGAFFAYTHLVRLRRVGDRVLLEVAARRVSFTSRCGDKIWKVRPSVESEFQDLAHRAIAAQIDT